MLGSGDPTPYDGYALIALSALAVLLLIGCILGQTWSIAVASIVRRAAFGLVVLVLGAVLIVTPTSSGAVGAGRMITIFPASALATLLFIVWSWRAGHV